MRKWLSRCTAIFAALAITVCANEVRLNQDISSQTSCQGMYGRKSWGGSIDPFILISFQQDESAEPTGSDMVGLVVYEYQDQDLLGKLPLDGQPPRYYYCDDKAINDYHLCNATQKYEYILADNATTLSRSPMLTQAINIKDTPAPINYPVTRTGYYCVGTNADKGQKYSAVVEFRNAYGELPAAQIPKLPFYGGISIVYALVGIFWGLLYFQNRSDILAVQNYITAILVYLVVEMILTWGYFDYQNRHGINIGTRVFMIVVAILNAGRNSFSFFLLLIVCMGYGVVKHTLGKTMVYVRWLAAVHFVFGVIYAIASLTVQPDDAGPLILLVILPLSASLTAFYVWTLNSLNFTMKDLQQRKQHVKARMYKQLWWAILGSILVIFAFFFLNAVSLSGVGNEDFGPTHWQSRWFVLDGWLNIVYFADVCFIAFVWRPTANNRRFAMSDEIAQDDDGFEIASIRDSLDEEDGPGAAAAKTPSESNNGSDLPAYQSMPTERQSRLDSGIDRQASPLPAPKPQKPSSLPRQSLDGDTIFAVGEEDRWSDDEAGDDERKKLTGKSD